MSESNPAPGGDGSSPPMSRFPLAPLILTMAMQTLATMAAFSAPTLAPDIARDLGVDGHLIGYFVATLYGLSVFSALFSPDFIQKFGAVRVGQFILVCAILMLVIGGLGSVLAMAICAVVIACGYGAAAPASTHLLMPRTDPKTLNLVFSIRQIGVPLGGVLAALILPWVSQYVGWRGAFWLQIVPLLVVLVILQFYRKDWDQGRKPAHQLFKTEFWRPFLLLRDDKLMRRLSLSSFFYAGIQLCFIGFLVLQLTERAALDLVTAGQVLAVYQILGVATRPVWGWIADRFISSIRLIGMMGLLIAVSALAAGQISESWPLSALFAVAAVAGATASGFSGLIYAAFAEHGGAYRTEATALGASVMALGVLLMPTVFGFIIGETGEYWQAYGLCAVIVAAAGLWLMSASPKRDS